MPNEQKLRELPPMKLPRVQTPKEHEPLQLPPLKLLSQVNRLMQRRSNQVRQMPRTQTLPCVPPNAICASSTWNMGVPPVFACVTVTAQVSFVPSLRVVFA